MRSATEEGKKRSRAKATVVQVAVVEKSEWTGVVVCLRVGGGMRISVDAALDHHDGRSQTCVLDCGNRCTKEKARGH